MCEREVPRHLEHHLKHKFIRECPGLVNGTRDGLPRAGPVLYSGGMDLSDM